MKLEREAKQSSEMVDRRENEASSNQMKADGREIDRTSGPFRAGFQKNLANQTSSLKTSLSRSASKAMSGSKNLKLKEELEVFEDKTKTKRVCTIKANKVIDFSAAYHFYTENEQLFGSIQRKGLRSL